MAGVGGVFRNPCTSHFIQKQNKTDEKIMYTNVLKLPTHHTRDR